MCHSDKSLRVKVSFVLPAFNEAKQIVPVLRSLNQIRTDFAVGHWESELIVCDNNSDDGTADLARSEGAKVVFESKNQISRARNRGASVARGEWLVFVDADTYPSHALLEDMAAAMDSGRVLGGGSTLKMDCDGFVIGFMTGLWNWVSRISSFAAGSFIFCEREAFESLEGFSLDLYAGEELEFSKRGKQMARRQGKSWVILTRHPAITSSRKIRLYRPREIMAFFARAILFSNRTLRNRKSCGMWYDGRR